MILGRFVDADLELPFVGMGGELLLPRRTVPHHRVLWTTEHGVCHGPGVQAIDGIRFYLHRIQLHMSLRIEQIQIWRREELVFACSSDSPKKLLPDRTILIFADDDGLNVRYPK